MNAWIVRMLSRRLTIIRWVLFGALVLFAVSLSELAVSFPVKKGWEKDYLAQKYLVQIATNANFLGIYKEMQTHKSYVELDLPSGRYYFRVAGIKDSLIGQWSNILVVDVNQENSAKDLEMNPNSARVISTPNQREQHTVRFVPMKRTQSYHSSK